MVARKVMANSPSGVGKTPLLKRLVNGFLHDALMASAEDISMRRHPRGSLSAIHPGNHLDFIDAKTGW